MAENPEFNPALPVENDSGYYEKLMGFKSLLKWYPY